MSLLCTFFLRKVCIDSRFHLFCHFLKIFLFHYFIAWIVLNPNFYFHYNNCINYKLPPTVWFLDSIVENTLNFQNIFHFSFSDYIYILSHFCLVIIINYLIFNISISLSINIFVMFFNCENIHFILFYINTIYYFYIDNLIMIIFPLFFI